MEWKAATKGQLPRKEGSLQELPYASTGTCLGLDYWRMHAGKRHLRSKVCPCSQKLPGASATTGTALESQGIVVLSLLLH